MGWRISKRSTIGERKGRGDGLASSHPERKQGEEFGPAVREDDHPSIIPIAAKPIFDFYQTFLDFCAASFPDGYSHGPKVFLHLCA